MEDQTEFSVRRIFLILSYAVIIHAGVAALYLFGSPPEPFIVEPPSPRAYLRSECQDPDCDFWLLDNIAECESRWQMVQNKRSTAFGFFQILDGTEKTTPEWQEGGTKTDPYDNIDMAIYLYGTRSWQPWISSRACWGWRYQRRLASLPGKCVGVCAE